MSTINLNTRGNSMPSGKKSIILFYEEMIEVAKNNIGCVTDFNTVIDEKFISSVISFIYLYFIIFFIVTSLLSINGLDLISALSAAATAISNVGPGLGDTIGPNGNFSEISNNSKWILSFAMILGRLELFAILVLFIPSFWRKF